MQMWLALLLGFISLASSVAGLLMTRKKWSNTALIRFSMLLGVLAVLQFGFGAWQSVLSARSGEDAKKNQLGDVDHPPHIAIISLPNKTFFVRINTSDFPAYSAQIHLYDEAGHPMRNYGPEEMAAHIGTEDNNPWTVNDNLEHRFTAEIITRTGMAHEELILRPAGNNQWMMACRVDGQVSKCQPPDSAWPRDQNGGPVF